MIGKVVHGNVIKALRRQANVTQKVMAMRVGCSQSQIWRVENDPRQYVSAELIARIADELTATLGRPIPAEDLISDLEQCPTCGSSLALSA